MVRNPAIDVFYHSITYQIFGRCGGAGTYGGRGGIGGHRGSVHILDLDDTDANIIIDVSDGLDGENGRTGTPGNSSSLVVECLTKYYNNNGYWAAPAQWRLLHALPNEHCQPMIPLNEYTNTNYTIPTEKEQAMPKQLIEEYETFVLAKSRELSDEEKDSVLEFISDIQNY